MPFLARRALFYLVAAWVALTVNFVLPRTMPGDPATAMFASYKGQLQPNQLESLKKAYGLTGGAWWQQYLTYLSNILRGHFGISLSQFPVPVIDVISTGLRWSILLGLVGLLTSFVIGTLLGAIAAWRRGGWVDSTLPPALMFIGSFPYFFLAMLAVYVLGVRTGWMPLNHAYGDDITPGFDFTFLLSVAKHLILPAGTIILVSLGSWMMGMRNAMIGVLSEDYLTMAEGKGLSEKRILFHYAMRNALLPSVTALGMGIGFIFSGQILTEIVFGYPGLGYLLYQGVLSLDYPLMQALFLIITLAILAANFMTDLLYVILDPRIRGVQVQTT